LTLYDALSGLLEVGRDGLPRALPWANPAFGGTRSGLASSLGASPEW